MKIDSYYLFYGRNYNKAKKLKITKKNGNDDANEKEILKQLKKGMNKI